MPLPTTSHNATLVLAVVAAPKCAPATRLAHDLRQLGLTVIHVTNIDAVKEAVDDAAVCIVVMTANTWDSPPLIAAVMAHPPRLIPVLGEPMQLPQGPWSDPALLLNKETAMTIAEWIGYQPEISLPTETLIAVKSSTPKDIPGLSSQISSVTAPMAPTTSDNTVSAEQPPVIQAIRTSFIQRTRQSAMAIGAVALAFIIVLSWLLPHIIHADVHPTPAIGSAYQADIPGKGCDRGAAYWSNTDGQNTKLTCQSDRLDITQPANADHYTEVYFNGTGTFAEKYRITVATTLPADLPMASFGVEVHGQMPTGGQIFEITPGGQWRINHYGKDGSGPKQLAFGVASPFPKTTQLQIDVDGAVMSFTVNGAKLATVTDGDYMTTLNIALVTIGNSNSSKPFTASFAHFSYTPQGTASLPATKAVATATAQASSLANAPYEADVPGPGCDTGKGIWEAPATHGDMDTIVTCQSNAMTLSLSPSNGEIGETRFYGTTGSLPSNYSIEVMADITNVNNGCGVIFTRNSANGSYGYFFCTDGTWHFDQYDGAGKQNIITHGTLTRKARYDILITETGQHHSMTIDSHVALDWDDAVLSNTVYVSLGLSEPRDYTGSITYNTFTLTQMQ
jgi:hypothetical protein